MSNKKSNRQVPFVGISDNRQGDLDKLLAFCKKGICPEYPGGLFFIEGRGGFGKTRLFESCREQLKDCDELEVFEHTFDLDDNRFYFVEGIRETITTIQENGNDAFEVYHEKRKNHERNKRGGGLTFHEEEREFQECLKAWNEAVLKSTDGKPLIVFLDTTDAMANFPELRRRIENELFWPSRKSIRFVIAGRYAVEERQERFKNDPWVLELKLEPFQKSECESYIRQKMEIEAISYLLPQGTSKKTFKDQHNESVRLLIQSSESNLVLIDLYLMLVHRIGYAPLLKEDDSFDVFSEKLIHAYLNSDQTIQRIVRLLSHCYPMNIETLTAFTFPGDPSPDKLFSYLAEMAFVKLLPNGFLRLHDVLREICEKYVYPQWKDSPEYLEYSRKFSQILDRSITDTENSIADTKNSITFKWTMKVQKMKHEIFLALHAKEDPFKLIQKLFLESDQSPELGNESRAMMMTEALEALKEYDRWSFMMQDLFIRYYVLKGDYSEAKNRILQAAKEIFNHFSDVSDDNRDEVYAALEKNEGFSQAKKLVTWKDNADQDGETNLHSLAIHRWKIDFDRGRLRSALAHLEELSDLHDGHSEAFRKYNLMGLTLVDLGEFDNAVDYHQRALKKIIAAGPEKIRKTDVANVQNCASYAYALARQHDSSYEASRHAIVLYDQDHNAWGMGQAFVIKGRSRLEFNRVNSAKRNFNRAEKYFLNMNADEKMRLYLGLAHVALLENDLKTASHWLESRLQSKDFSESRLLALYHQLCACLDYRRSADIRHNVIGVNPWINLDVNKWLDSSNDRYVDYLNNLRKSRSCFEKAINANTRMESQLYAIFATSGFVRTMIDELITLGSSEEEDYVANSLKLAIKEKEQWLKDILWEFPDYEKAWSPPLLMKQFADFYLVLGEEDKAIRYYKQSLPKIAENRRHEPFSITGQLQKTQDHILYYMCCRDGGKLNAVGLFAGRLLDFWNKTYQYDYQEVAQIFSNWKSGNPTEWGGTIVPSATTSRRNEITSSPFF